MNSPKVTDSVRVIYPGSFDPPTLGHLDVIERAARLFPQLTVLIANSPRKTSWFTALERKKLLQEVLKHLPSVQVDAYDGLTVDYLKKHGGRVIIRGLRAVSDFEYELQMATMNRKLLPEVETFVIMTDERFHYISSHTVKEVALYGGDVSGLVPAVIVDAIAKKIKSHS